MAQHSDRLALLGRVEEGGGVLSKLREAWCPHRDFPSSVRHSCASVYSPRSQGSKDLPLDLSLCDRMAVLPPPASRQDLELPVLKD